jgi:myosin heavy subunit
MVLIAKINEDAIADNLKKRFLAECVSRCVRLRVCVGSSLMNPRGDGGGGRCHDSNIYTYIGPVLIALNPYKNIDQYGDRDVEQYQGSVRR